MSAAVSVFPHETGYGRHEVILEIVDGLWRNENDPTKTGQTHHGDASVPNFCVRQFRLAENAVKEVIAD